MNAISGTLLLLFCHMAIGTGTKEDLAHGVHHPIHEEHFQGSLHNVEFDHDAVLGSEKANAEFRDLPPHEAKKRLATMVDRMDVNRDGNIDRDELTAWIAESFINLNKEEALQKMASQDKNSDRRVTWEEYLRSVYDYEPDELIDMKVDKNPDVQALYSVMAEDKSRFQRADLDRDGALTPEEYTPFLHPHDFPHMQEYELDRTLTQYDTNGDRRVSFKEYLGDDPGSKEMQLVDKENFNDYDADSDGFLSREELRSWVLPDFRDSVSAEVDHLFVETDLDKSGILSKQEILDMHHFWVGSAATDYGSQLHRHDPQEL